MADSHRSTFQFTCPECFVGLKASVGRVGARLTCPSCQAKVVVPEAPEISQRDDVAQKHDIYDVRSGNTNPDDGTYLTVLCPVCHTRMYAIADQIGRKMTCPDCGTDTIVARPVEFLAQKEDPEPVEVDGSMEYAIREVDHPPTADRGEADQLQIPVVCPLCQTRMHADESQVGSTIVCPDCETETLVPEAPELQPKPELPDVGEYGVGKPSEVLYPRFARMLDKPLDEPDTPPDGTPRRPTPPRTKP